MAIDKSNIISSQLSLIHQNNQAVWKVLNFLSYIILISDYVDIHLARLFLSSWYLIVLS